LHQTLDLPEALVTGREDIYLGWFYRNYGARPLADEEISEYLRTYRQPGALRAGFSFYRAIPQDIADNAALLASGFRLPMPVLALGGDSAWGRRMEVVESLQRLATDVRGGVVENCGHWMPEEQPEELLRQLLAFFGG
jgi:pimeloyl-ACP methyl ester carboxylesterase